MICDEDSREFLGSVDSIAGGSKTFVNVYVIQNSGENFVGLLISDGPYKTPLALSKEEAIKLASVILQGIVR